MKTLLAELNAGIFEKETEIGLSLLAALAGQSVLLLGPPGTAKSLVARRVKSAFRDAKSFEYLMSRFSTPDELFGPVSISRLRAEDCYERMTGGYLPEADIVFLDEIWKAGPAILNTLLTIVNEHIFRNGQRVASVPLKLLIGASNELPAEGEGLEALWDRFVVRIVSHCVTSEEHLHSILLSDTQAEVTLPDELQITAEEYAGWQRRISAIGIDAEALMVISAIRGRLTSVNLTPDEVAGNSRKIYVSDRRWKMISRIMRASAFVHGRESASPADLLPCVHSLWNEPDEVEAVRAIVLQSVFVSVTNGLDALRKELDAVTRRKNTLRILQEMRSLSSEYDDSDKRVFDGYFYQIESYGTGNTFILMSDYRRLRTYSNMVYDFRKPDASPIMVGLVYGDPDRPGRQILRVYPHGLNKEITDNLTHQGKKPTMVKVARDASGIYINGAHYPLCQVEIGKIEQLVTEDELMAPPSIDLEAEAERLSQLTTDILMDCKRLLFASVADIRVLDKTASEINRRIAHTRNDINVLLYE